MSYMCPWSHLSIQTYHTCDCTYLGGCGLQKYASDPPRTVILPKNDLLQRHFRSCRTSIMALTTKLRGLMCSLGPNQSYKLLRPPIPATWGAVWHKIPPKMVIFAKITSFHHGGSNQLCPWPILGVPAWTCVISHPLDAQTTVQYCLGALGWVSGLHQQCPKMGVSVYHGTH